MTKIVQLVNSCRECPNRHYYSAGTYECEKVQPSRLNADMSIPGWCPLPDMATDDSFEQAMRQTWQMVDPIRPAGEPGSYFRGEHNGICAALKTLRDNYVRAKGTGTYGVIASDGSQQ